MAKSAPKYARAIANQSHEKNKIRHMMSEYHKHPNNIQALDLAKARQAKLK